jgi:hypothetical protein
MPHLCLMGASTDSNVYYPRVNAAVSYDMDVVISKQAVQNAMVAMVEEPHISNSNIEVCEEAKRIGALLNESNLWFLHNTLALIGPERVETLVEQTLRIEEQGGLTTLTGERRRTAGGVFFKLLKDETTRAQQKVIFTLPPHEKKAPECAPVQPLPPLVPLPWDEAKAEIARVFKGSIERTTVRITLVGRPSQVSKAKTCMVVAMKGAPPPSLPRGLPNAPDASDFTYAIFISNKHWSRVGPQLERDQTGKLIIEGYPIFDPKRGITVILAQNVRVSSGGKKESEASNNHR